MHGEFGRTWKEWVMASFKSFRLNANICIIAQGAADITLQLLVISASVTNSKLLSPHGCILQLALNWCQIYLDNLLQSCLTIHTTGTWHVIASGSKLLLPFSPHWCVMHFCIFIGVIFTSDCVSSQRMCAVKLYDLWSAASVPVGFKVLSYLSHP
jgi:hypothetical protein